MQNYLAPLPAVAEHQAKRSETENRFRNSHNHINALLNKEIHIIKYIIDEKESENLQSAMSIALIYGGNGGARTCGWGCCCGEGFWKNLENIVGDDDPNPKSSCDEFVCIRVFLFLRAFQVPCESPVWCTVQGCSFRWSDQNGRWCGAEGKLGPCDFNLQGSYGDLIAGKAKSKMK